MSRKVAKRTEKLEGQFGHQVLVARRNGLVKVLGLLSRGTGKYVSDTPRAVELTANTFSL